MEGPHPTSPDIDRLLGIAETLPFPLAMALAEYATEPDPYIRLHRLVDGAEMLTRFTASILLADVLRLYGSFSPEPPVKAITSIRNILIDSKLAPSFGQWHQLVITGKNAILSQTRSVPELPDFVTKYLLPALNMNVSSADRHLIPMRNDLAHAGRSHPTQVRRWLATFAPIFESLFERCAFFDSYTLAAFDTGLNAIRLRGLPDPVTGFAPFDVSGISRELRPGSVYLINDAHALELFPLQTFAPVFHHRSPKEPVAGVAPQMFFRRQPGKYVEYVVLVGEEVLSQQTGGTLQQFDEIFPIDAWKRMKEPDETDAASIAASSPFDELRADLGRVFVGRSKQVRIANEAIERSDGGVLWIGGKPGIGKSALMAHMADHFERELERERFVTVPYFFRLGHSGCSVDEFVQATIRILATAAREPVNLAATVTERLVQAKTLVSAFVESDRRKLLFLVDGLDEIVRVDDSVGPVLADLGGQGVVIVCAGRPERQVEHVLEQLGAVTVFSANGLSRLETSDIRELLDRTLGGHRYQLFAEDTVRETGSLVDVAGATSSDSLVVENRTLDLVAERSEGLPLYITMLVEDIREGRIKVGNLEDLPVGLQAYFEQVLARLQVSDVGTVLAPLFCLLSWAREPVADDALGVLLAAHHLHGTRFWETTYRLAFEYGHMMLRPAATPDGRDGWTLYHETFRQHLRETPTVQGNREWSQAAWLRKCEDWQSTQAAGLHDYALRHYPEHLAEAEAWTDLMALADDDAFLQAQTEALRDDPGAPLRTLRRALDGAIGLDDPVAMAHLTLAHAMRLSAITRAESELKTLRADGLERALQMAELLAPEARAFQLLLLAWNAFGLGRTREAQECLQALLSRDLPRLSWRREEQAVDLVAAVADVLPMRFLSISRQLLGSEGRKALAIHFARAQRFESSSAVAYLIDNGQHQTQAFLEIGRELLAQGESDEAARILGVALEAANMPTASGEWPVRADLLAEIGHGLNEAGDETQATVAFADSLDLAAAMADQGDRAVAQRDVATELARAGRFAEAIDVAVGIHGQYNWTRPEAFAAIAVEQVAQDDPASAMITLTQVPSWLEEHPGTVRAVAAGWARAGHFDMARETLQLIPDEDKQWGVEEVVAATQATDGDEDGAWITAEAIAMPASRIRAFCGMGAAFADGGRETATLAAFQAARDTADDIEDSKRRTDALLLIAERATGAGELEFAQNLLADAFEEYAQDEGGDSTRQMLIVIAEAQVAVGAAEAAEVTYDFAKESVEDAETDDEFTKALWEVGRSMLRVGMTAAARNVFSLALNAGEEEMDAEEDLDEAERFSQDAAKTDVWKVTSIADLAVLQAEQGNRTVADEAFAMARKLADAASSEIRSTLGTIVAQRLALTNDFVAALETANAIEDADARRESLTGIATAQAGSGLMDEARSTFQKAHESMPDDGMFRETRGEEALRDLAIAQAEAGLLEDALKIANAGFQWSPFRDQVLSAVAIRQARNDEILEALATAQQINKYLAQYEALIAIAVQQTQQGDLPGAQATFLLAVEAVEGIGDDELEAPAYFAIGQAQAEAGWSLEARAMFDRAIEAAFLIDIPIRRNDLTAMIGTAVAFSGDVEGARSIAARIDTPWAQGQVEMAAILADVRTVGWDESVKLAKDLAYPFWTPVALYALAAGMRAQGVAPETGLMLSARTSAQAVPQGQARERLLAQLFEVLLPVDAFDEAIEAIRVLEVNRPEILREIGHAAVESGNMAAIRRLLHDCAVHEVAAFHSAVLLGRAYPDSLDGITRVILRAAG